MQLGLFYTGLYKPRCMTNIKPVTKWLLCILHRRTSAGKRFGSAPAVHSPGVRKFTNKPLPHIRRRHLHLHGQQLPWNRRGLGRPRGLGWVCVCVCVLKCIDHRLSLYFMMSMFKCVCMFVSYTCAYTDVHFLCFIKQHVHASLILLRIRASSKEQKPPWPAVWHMTPASQSGAAHIHLTV